MSIIKGKNKEEVIKILKKLGDVVLIAKAEVLYAFKKPYFPTQTIEQIMEEIKKSPKGYKYYQVGDITITEISEVKEEIKEEIKEDSPRIKAFKKAGLNVVSTPEELKAFFEEDLRGKIDCKECDLYGECDHQGAYKKDGKWCYQDEKAELEEGTVFGTGSLSDQHKFEEKGKWVNKKKKKD